jgi:anthranilate synthase component 1
MAQKSIIYYPDLNEFKKLAKKGNLIPVYREIFADTETPVSAFKKLNTVDHCFLLESVEAVKNGHGSASSGSARR